MQRIPSRTLQPRQGRRSGSRLIIEVFGPFLLNVSPQFISGSQLRFVLGSERQCDMGRVQAPIPLVGDLELMNCHSRFDASTQPNDAEHEHDRDESKDLHARAVSRSPPL